MWVQALGLHNHYAQAVTARKLQRMALQHLTVASHSKHSTHTFCPSGSCKKSITWPLSSTYRHDSAWRMRLHVCDLKCLHPAANSTANAVLPPPALLNSHSQQANGTRHSLLLALSTPARSFLKHAALPSPAFRSPRLTSTSTAWHGLPC